jgi:hypothetical protein
MIFCLKCFSNREGFKYYRKIVVKMHLLVILMPDVVFVLVLVCSLQLVNVNIKAEEHYTISTTHYIKYLIGGKN